MDLAHAQVCQASHSVVVEAVERVAAVRGFRILEKRDIQALLAAKGFSIAPLVIFEAVPVRGRSGFRALPDVIARCRIQVSEVDGRVVISVLRPAVLCDALLRSPVEDIIRLLDQAVIGLVDEVAATSGSSST